MSATDAAIAEGGAGLRLYNPVLLALVAIGGLATASTGFLTIAPNRLISGSPIGLLNAVGTGFAAAIVGAGLALIICSLLPPTRSVFRVASAIAGAALLLLLTAAGQGAESLVAAAPRLARVSLGPAFWILLVASGLALVDAMQRARAGAAEALALAVVICAAAGVMAHLGQFEALSLVREFHTRQAQFGAALLRHIELVAGAVGAAVAIGFPLGVALVRRPAWQGSVFALLNLMQTVPSIALFGLLLAPLSALAAAFPLLASLGIGGVGVAPAMIALVLYSLLPVVRNTVAGIGEVDAGVLDAARGIGLSRRQRFWQVELPLAAPLLLAGLRIVLVQAIGLAVIAALIGAGGLGTFVFEGLGQYAADLVLLGALPAIFLALAANFLMQFGGFRGPPMIEIAGVSKFYGERRIIDDLTLSIPAGTLCVLLGPSGCGKSTTLRIINRLVPFDAGTIRVGGDDINAVPPEILRRRIGYAIQSTGLFPHWTVEDNIATVPRLLKWERARVRDRVTEMLELFRLDPAIYRGKYPQQLSGGEQQRVGVARALAADPDVLLMDEPFAAIDPVNRAALQAELLNIQQSTEKTVVFVTHDIDEALRLASVIAIMEGGRLAQYGQPLELVEQPANDFVTRFVNGGEGGGVKALALRTLAERVRSGESAEGEPLPSTATLRDAFAAMAARHADRLPVVDPTGSLLGVITLADLIR